MARLSRFPGQPDKSDGRVGDGPAATANTGGPDAHVAATGRQLRKHGNLRWEGLVITIRY